MSVAANEWQQSISQGKIQGKRDNGWDEDVLTLESAVAMVLEGYDGTFRMVAKPDMVEMRSRDE